MRPKPITASVLSASSTPREAAALPAAVDQRRVGLRDVARQRQHQRDRVLGGRQRVRLRRVADQDAARRGRLDVDVVDARAGPADHAQPRPGCDQLGVDAGGGAHDERVVVADALQQLGPVEAGRDVDLGRLAQPVDAGRGDGLGDEDPHAAWAREKAPTPAPSSIGCPAPSSSTSSAARPRTMSPASIAPNEPMRRMRPSSSPWPPATVMPWPVAQALAHRLAVDARRPQGRRHQRAVVAVGRVQLEAQRRHGGAHAAAEPPGALEPRLQPVGLDDRERRVEGEDQRDGGRERRLALRLRLQRAIPVEREARVGRRPRALQRALGDRRERQARAASSAPSATRSRPRRGPRRRSRAASRRATRWRRRPGRRSARASARRSPARRRWRRSRSRSARRTPPRGRSRPFTRAATASGSGRLPQGERSTSTSARYASPIFTQRSPKLPAETTRILSPGESRLAKADSNAAVPLELNRITSRSVRYTRCRPVSTRASTALNSGERWCGSGSASAATTAGGMGVGPGVSSRFVTRRAGPAAVPGRPSGRPSRRRTASPGR